MAHHHHHHHGAGHTHDHNNVNPNYNHDLCAFFPSIFSQLVWKNNEKVLDYGCGAGGTGYKYLFPEVLKHDSELFSVDINESKVQEAKKNFPHLKITYGTGNILGDFPFSGEKFDKIFSIYVFHFVPDIGEAMKRLRSLLQDGGYLVVTMHKTAYFDAIRALAKMEKWAEYAKGYEGSSSEFAYTDSQSCEESLGKMMEGAGFKVLHTEMKDMSYGFEDIDNVLESTMGNFPFIGKVPDNLKPELKEDYRTVMTGLFNVPRDTTKFDFKYQCIAFAGQKA